jgi:hypothetical protein
MRLGLQRGMLPSILYPLLFAFLGGIFYFLFQIACSHELDAILKRVPRFAAVVTLIGVSTLELYFVHERLKEFTWLQRIVFPLNIVALWVLILPIAAIVEKCVTMFRKRWLKVQ